MRMYSSQSICVEVDWSGIKLSSSPFLLRSLLTDGDYSVERAMGHWSSGKYSTDYEDEDGFCAMQGGVKQ
jgi:hypothetical protein